MPFATSSFIITPKLGVCETGSSSTVAYPFNLRYPGQYHDAETGLHYNYFRDYDPSTGRYVQSDPIGLIGGDSTFSYAANNPTFLTDQYGLISKEQLNTFLGRADRGREMTTCTTQLWRGIISGDQSALAVALDHCSFDFPLVDREKLERICDLYREGRSLKKMDEQEVARRLGLDVRSFHKEFKDGIVRSNRQSLKDHGMGNNPDVILGKDNRVFLRDIKTGMTIPITP